MQRRSSYLLIGVSLALILGGAAAGQAPQVVWSGLVIANNVAQPDEIPAELLRIEGTAQGVVWLQPIQGDWPIDEKRL